MKTITQFLAIHICAFFIVLLPCRLSAQDPYWSIPQALTDSSLNNMNAIIIQPGYGEIHLLFWERHVDAATSEICMREIYNPPFSDEQVVLSMPLTWLSNPIVFNTQYLTDSIYYYLFYQTNEANDIDIKYVKYYTDGTFSAPHTFSSAEGDDINLHADGYSGSILWENEGKIMISKWNYQTETFSISKQVDNSGAYSPTFFESGSKIAWLKTDGFSSYLKYAEIAYQADSIVIQNIDSIELDGDAGHLTAMGNMEFLLYSTSLAFQKRVYGSDKWGLCFVDFRQSPPELTNHQSSNYNYLTPAIWDVLIGVDAIGELNIAFVSDSMGNNEVFATPNMFDAFPDNVVNVSNFGGDDLNSSFFLTTHSIYYRCQLLWESFRNGHWVIYRSYMDVSFGSTEESLTRDNVIISSNPFKDKVSIRFKSSSPIDQVKILNMRGQCVNTLNPISLDKEHSTVTWDGKDAYDQQVPAGSYIVSFPSVNGTTSKIILKSE